MVFLVEAHYIGILTAAGSAPRCPEVDHHHLATQVGEATDVFVTNRHVVTDDNGNIIGEDIQRSFPKKRNGKNCQRKNKEIVDNAMKTLQGLTDTSSEEYNNALNILAKASYDTKNDAATKEATSYVKASKYNELYGQNEAAARESLKSQYYAEDGVTLLDGKTEEDFNNAVSSRRRYCDSC